MSLGCSVASSVLDLDLRVDRAPVPGDRDHWSERSLVRLQQSVLPSEPDRQPAAACAHAGAEKRTEPAMVGATGLRSARLDLGGARQCEVRSRRPARKGEGAAEPMRAWPVRTRPLRKCLGTLEPPASRKIGRLNHRACECGHFHRRSGGDVARIPCRTGRARAPVWSGHRDRNDQHGR